MERIGFWCLSALAALVLIADCASGDQSVTPGETGSTEAREKGNEAPVKAQPEAPGKAASEPASAVEDHPTFQKIETYEDIIGNWVMIREEYFHTGPQGAAVEFLDTTDTFPTNRFRNYLIIKENAIESVVYSTEIEKYKKVVLCDNREDLEFYKNFISYKNNILRLRFLYGDFGIRVYSNQYFVRSESVPVVDSKDPIEIQNTEEYGFSPPYTITDECMHWGYAQDGLILGIKLDIHTTEEGNIFLLHYCLRNLSDKEISLRSAMNDSEKVYLNVVMLNDKNEPVYSTSNIDNFVNFIKLESQKQINGTIELFSREHRGGRSEYIRGIPEICRVDISNLKKGKYKIMAYYCFCFPTKEWTFAWWGVVKSKFVSFTIE